MCRTTRVAIVGALAMAFSVSLSAESVWHDALLRIRGAVDRNGDGLWTATDYTSANTEIPDVMHAAETMPASTKILYNMTAHADSNVRIVEQEVKLSAEGRTVTRPVLYFPQPHFVDNGANKARLQCFKLFNGQTPPLTNDDWSAVFRLKPEVFKLQKTDGKGNDAMIGSSWFFNFPGSGGAFEMRLGVRTKDGDKTGFLNLCTGNMTNNEKADLVATNDWMEVSIVMTGRVVRLSCGIPGKLRRWATHTIPTGSGYPTSVRPTLFRLGDCGRGATESCDGGNADGFRGWIETVGIWNRGLTDAEVVEAFGGPNPGIVGVGEEGASAKMFAGAKATGAVTLDTTEHDQRLWPASYGQGAVISIPFTVDKYRAGLMQALRMVPQKGSAGGTFLAKIDGLAAGRISVLRCAANETPVARFLALKAGFFTQGGHTLTLTCVSAGGDVLLDRIEIGGGWMVGDGNGGDVSYDSDTGWATSTTTKPWADTYYASSMNIKDFSWYLGGSSSLRRDKVIFWNVPSGLPAHATYKITYRLTNGSGADGATTVGRNIFFKVNGETVNTVVARGGNQSYSFNLPSGKLADGLNELRLAVETLESKPIWINPTCVKLEMTSCENDFISGLMVIVR